MFGFDGGLIVFDGQQKIGAVFEDRVAGGLVLGVEGVQADFAPVQVEFLEQLPGDGDFVGLGVHDGAAQIMLAGHADGGEHRMAAALPRLLAVQDDQVLLGRGPRIVPALAGKAVSNSSASICSIMRQKVGWLGAG